MTSVHIHFRSTRSVLLRSVSATEVLPKFGLNYCAGHFVTQTPPEPIPILKLSNIGVLNEKIASIRQNKAAGTRLWLEGRDRDRVGLRLAGREDGGSVYLGSCITLIRAVAWGQQLVGSSLPPPATKIMTSDTGLNNLFKENKSFTINF